MSQREWSQERELARRNAASQAPRRAAPVPGRDPGMRRLEATNIARRDAFEGAVRPGLQTEREGEGWTDEDVVPVAAAALARSVPAPPPIATGPATPMRRLPPGVRGLEATNIARRDNFETAAAPTAQTVPGFESAD